jgi:predicted phage-related endonuclease
MNQFRIEPKPEHGSPEWLRSRQRDQHGRIRFGGSDAPTLMGVNEYATLVDLFIAKHDLEPTQVTSKAFHRGNLLEPVLIAEAGRLLNLSLLTPDVMFCRDRLMVNLDGANSNDNPTVIVEAKTSTRYSINDPIPKPYFWQATAQLACTNAEVCYVICLDRRQEIGMWEVPRYEPHIQEILQVAETIGARFDNHEIPEGATVEQIVMLHPQPEGVVELDDEQHKLINQWSMVKTHLNALEDDEKALRNRIAEIIGEHQEASFNGNVVATFKPRKLPSRLDQKALQEAHPELVEKFTKTGGTTRVLRLTKGKE